jgi:serine/threonine protein phosphatase PrpC
MNQLWPVLGQDPDSVGNTTSPQLLPPEPTPPPPPPPDLYTVVPLVAEPAADNSAELPPATELDAVTTRLPAHPRIQLDAPTVVIKRGAAASGTCPSCGGRIDADGYCQTCGAKAPNPRDHLEFTANEDVAAVSDRGVVHYRNEDAVAVFADDTRAVLVVSDGVSTSTDSDVASLAAAEKACQYLASAPARIESLQEAISLANQAVIAATDPSSPNAAAATMAAALLLGRELFFANLGDSRIYWVGEDSAKQLTVDHSLAQDLIESGVSREIAETSAGAHAITAWLGPDCEDQTPQLSQQTLEPGWLVVCSDGLWNYASAADQLAELARGGETPLEKAKRLVEWAKAQGGQDNISVAVARLVP